MPEEKLPIASLARIPEGTPTIMGGPIVSDPSVASNEPQYPIGAKIHLEHQELSKMGVPDNVPAGTRIYFQGYGEVAASEIGEQGPQMTMQITDLGMQPAAQSQADTLYPDG